METVTLKVFKFLLFISLMVMISTAMFFLPKTIQMVGNIVKASLLCYYPCS